MNKKVLILSLGLFFACCLVRAQDTQKSELQQRAESSLKDNKTIDARYNYIRAYEDYMNKGNYEAGTECGVRAVALYYGENLYKEAFDLLSRIEQNIKGDPSSKAAQHYLTSKERYEMYMRMKRPASALDHLKAMENYSNASGKDDIKNDFLYNKAIYHYTFGQTAQGNAVFKEMADKLTASKEYDKVDEVYKTLIANGRKSGNANLVANSYSNYIAWKDSAIAMKHADEVKALNKQIADHEFQKTYLAVVQDHGLSERGHFEDLLYKDPKTNMVKVDPRGKKASLDYKVLKRKDDLALVEVDLHTGRSHQIRVQFSSRNHPLWGDQRYNKKAIKGQQIALWSHRICFKHPISKEELTFTSEIDRYPFNI